MKMTRSQVEQSDLFKGTLLLSLVLFADVVQSYNVLMSQAVSTGSHELVLRKIGEHLIEKGHNVTQIRFVSAHNRFMPSQTSVRVLSRRVLNNQHGRLPNYNSDGEFVMEKRNVWSNESRPLLTFQMRYITVGYCEGLLASPELLDLLKQHQFHVAIMDMMGNQCGFALARLLKLHVIGFTVVTPHATDQGDFVSWLNPPSITVMSFTELAPNMNLMQRVYNVLAYLTWYLVTLGLEHVANPFIQAHRMTASAGTFDKPTADVYIVQQNFLATQAITLPAHAEATGYCPPETDHETLTEELRMLFKKSEHGVILFSMGLTLYEPEFTPANFISAFLEAFARVPQTVLMRFQLPSTMKHLKIPKNVHLVRWLPQSSALSHWKTKLFITHGGINSYMEAISHGVPMLIVPLYGDQYENSKILQMRGFGRHLDKWSLNQDSVHEAVTDLINNKSYRWRIRRAAKLWRTFECPADAVERWVKYLSLHGPPRQTPAYNTHHQWAPLLLAGISAAFVVSAWLTYKLLTSLCK